MRLHEPAGAFRKRRGIGMMPLMFASPGDEVIIKKVGGSAETKKHLEDLGFVVGGALTVVNSGSGNLIVKVKETRIAITKEMAAKIMI